MPRFKKGFDPRRGEGRGRKPRTTPQTVWVLESLKKKGVDYTQKLADAINTRDIEMINALARLAPHIANKPKETHGIEGIEGLVIKELPDAPKE